MSTNRPSPFLRILIPAILVLLTAAPALADVAKVEIQRDLVLFHPTVEAPLFVGVTGPGAWKDFLVAREPGETLALETIDYRGLPLRDGVYTYEIGAMERLSGEELELLARARKELDDTWAEEIRAKLEERLRGSFAVVDGAFVDRPAEPEKFVSDRDVNLALKDVLHYDDVIITGSLCVGFDCVNGESFGYDTIRLKENNLRIHFEDTSSLGGYPTNDWRIVINDSVSGGGSYFAIEDSTNSRTPFKIEAGAPTASLYVEDYGRVGLGTSVPYVELHIKDGDTPTMRLDQDGSSGFAAQSWDVAGNETNFFIRDVTNGSKLSLRIQPGAPSSSLSIRSDGKVGLGTWSPAEPLHLSANAAAIRIENTTSGEANSWDLRTMSGSFVISDSGNTTQHEVQINDSGRFRVRASGTVTFDLGATGNLTIAGTLTENSDINSKMNLVPVDGREVLARVRDLPIVTWSLRDQPSALQMGPTAQDFYDVFGLGDTAEGLAPRNVASVALAAVQGLEREAAEKDLRIQELEERVAALEAMLESLVGGGS